MKARIENRPGVDNLTIDQPIEEERYELGEPVSFRFEVDRRDFCKVLGGGILIALVAAKGAAQESGGGGRRRGGNQIPKEIGAWLHIAGDGAVTVYTGKVEVGQDIRTSLSQVVAEELRVPMGQVRMVMGDTDLTPYDMGTFGSMTTRIMSPQLRKASAAARETLIELAAEHFNTDKQNLTAADGAVVYSAKKRSIKFGELAKGEKMTKTIPADIALTPAEIWKVAGKPVRRVSAPEIVSGKHKYASDVSRPGMLYGKVLRPPAVGATLLSADTIKAEGREGVRVVHDGDFVAVAAPSAYAATRALAEVHAEWKTTPQPSSKHLFEYLKENSDSGSERGGFSTGAVERALADAAHKLEQTYTVAYIAHVPLEPRAAVAEWEGDKLTVWTGTQRPFGVREDVAKALRMPEERIRVIMPDTGAGYGGKHTGEVAVEAARLAKSSGKPVKVVWTREEEFMWAYVRPAGVIEVKSGATGDGKLTAWEFHNYNSGGAAIRTPYEVPNQKIVFHPSRSPLRQGSYRGLAATANHFARESQMDDLAAALKLDPLEFRLRNLKDERLKAVFEAAATRFGWGKAKPGAGRGFGIAGGLEKGGYLATCVEVAVDSPGGQIKVLRVVAAFECGAIVNPDNLRNQVEGSIIMGLGGALFEALEFENGRLLNGRLSSYRVPRFSDAPTIDTILVDRKDLPTAGAGETPIVGIAPAIGNAVFSATGTRLRSLPMAPNGLKQPPVNGRS
jgi:nicotinate dehydrogenase subunit B